MDILSLVVGGSIGFLASIAKDWLLENKKQRLKKQEFQRDKLEEIYLLFEKWSTCFSTVYLDYLRCYRDRIPYDQVLENQLKESKLLLPGEAQKLQMLINIHFPNLTNEYFIVDNARSKVVTFFSDPQKNGLNANDFIRAQEEFEKVSYDFKAKIIAQVQAFS